MSDNPIIKFSHRYAKMPEIVDDTKLIEVFSTKYRDLSDWFRVYDTEYDIGYYELPRGELLVLMLISREPNAAGGSNEHLWTTIRRRTPEKEAYYRSMRGKQVNIVIEEATKC